MAIVINGEELSIAQKQKINGVDITEIKLNGETMWKYDVDTHTVPDMTVCLTRTGGSASGWVDASTVESSYWQAGPYYNYNSTSGTYRGSMKWTGGTVNISTSYSGRIDKTKLPNGKYIKTLIVYRYGGGALTLDMTDKDTVDVSDSKSNSVDCHPMPSSYVDGNSISATSGVSRIDYRYV